MLYGSGFPPVEQCPCEVVHSVLLVLNCARHNLCKHTLKQSKHTMFRCCMCSRQALQHRTVNELRCTPAPLPQPPVPLQPATPICRHRCTDLLQTQTQPASKLPSPTHTRVTLSAKSTRLTCVEGVMQEVVQVALNGQWLKQELLVVLLARGGTHQHTLANLQTHTCTHNHTQHSGKQNCCTAHAALGLRIAPRPPGQCQRPRRPARKARQAGVKQAPFQTTGSQAVLASSMPGREALPSICSRSVTG